MAESAPRRSEDLPRGAAGVIGRRLLPRCSSGPRGRRDDALDGARRTTAGGRDTVVTRPRRGIGSKPGARRREPRRSSHRLTSIPRTSTPPDRARLRLDDACAARDAHPRGRGAQAGAGRVVARASRSRTHRGRRPNTTPSRPAPRPPADAWRAGIVGAVIDSRSAVRDADGTVLRYGYFLRAGRLDLERHAIGPGPETPQAAGAVGARRGACRRSSTWTTRRRQRSPRSAGERASTTPWSTTSRRASPVIPALAQPRSSASADAGPVWITRRRRAYGVQAIVARRARQRARQAHAR